MSTHRLPSHRAFTLIELVLVLLVITFIVGIVAPTLRGFSKGARLRDTSEQFLTLTRLARVQALSTGKVHRVTMTDGRCVVAQQDGQRLVELTSEFEGSFTPPEGMTFQLTDLQGVARQFIEFYPNGRTQTSKLRIAMSDDGGSLDIECLAPTEGFHIVTPGVPR